MQTDQLITAKEALAILPFVSYAGLYRGCKGTDALTRFPAGRNTLYSRVECEKLRDKVLSAGRPRVLVPERPCPTELV